MSKKTKVLDWKNIPARPPIWMSLVVILALDHWGAREWVWTLGIAWIAIAWAAYIFLFVRKEKVDIFKDNNQKP